MARGWESKSVADQIDEGKERTLEAPAASEHSAEARERRQQLESLRLSRSRTLAQLEQATNPAHREMLTRGLRALEKEIEETKRKARIIAKLEA